ncbi:MAG: TetR/AcrR family transcriptional regulator [Solirubrobacteraceae bacterium]|nr:TetR/AcrR family transcriptional regulator [Solirubrobacteraceae bacterium]
MASRTVRESILDSATRAFVAQPAVNVSVAKIAEDAHVAVGSVYHHFGDKQALQLAVTARLMDLLLDGYLGPALDSDDPLPDRLLAHCTAYAAFAEEHPAEFLLMTSTTYPPVDTAAAEEGPGRVLGRVSAHLQRLMALVSDAQDQGIIRAGDPGRLVILVWSALYGICHLHGRYPAVVPATAGRSALQDLAEQIARDAMMLDHAA